MTISDWFRQAINLLSKNGIESARLDALLLLEHVLKADRTKILSDQNSILKNELIFKLDQLLNKRLTNYPIAYIVGFKEFYGHKFKVDANVFIPRPETEVLVDYVVNKAPMNSKCIEIGTGSGAIAISIKLARKDLKITASDISLSALHIAEKNSKTLNSQITFIESDLFCSITDKFDVVVANLPYITFTEPISNEVKKEPRTAIYGGQDGLNHYKKLAHQISNYINKGATIVIEHSPNQLVAITKLFKKLSGQIEKVSQFVTAFRL